MPFEEENPVFRKTVLPWYDSEAACLVMIIFMYLVFLFSATGIYVASENAVYRNFTWVPWLLSALSTVVIISTTIRLIRRYGPLLKKKN